MKVFSITYLLVLAVVIFSVAAFNNRSAHADAYMRVATQQAIHRNYPAVMRHHRHTRHSFHGLAQLRKQLEYEAETAHWW